MPARTLIDLMETSAKRFPDHVFLLEKPKDRYEGTTYAESRELVHRFSAGLQALGLEKGDRVALISEGRALWVVAEMGILYAGAINVPISVKINEPAELKFRLAHSGCRMAVVSAGQARKVEAIRKDLPNLETLILLDGEERVPDEISVDRLLALGDEWLAENPAGFEARWRGVEDNDPATITYTSGTTADPKGIVLTHRNYIANVEQGTEVVELDTGWTSLVIIPWDHSFGHTVGIYIIMLRGATLAAVQAGRSPMETLRNIPENIRETRPHFLLSVPALAANFRKNIEKSIRQKGPKVVRLFDLALQNAYAYIGEGWNKGRGIRALRRPLHTFFDRILFSKIREEGFGGRLEFFIGGGAYLDIEMQRFFYAIGIPMYQGYGLTEAAPVISTNGPKAHKLGTSGRLMPRLELRICDEEGRDLPQGEKGEILVRGENVMAGYWKNRSATAEALKDGWLHTGDLGFMDEDGYLHVLGRVKSLLISSNGEKYSPEGIEEALVSCSPYIDQVMLHNDHDPYTVALIVPNREALRAHLGKRGLSCISEEGQEAALSLFREAIDSFRKGGKREGMFEAEWLPAAFAVLGDGFTEENQMLNSTLKLVRRRVAEFYQDRIEHLHTPEGKSPFDRRNRAIISRLEE
jgi:long-chain acyl-CoA synthetase